jgi:membrane-associated phospholipid phosphatase
MHAMGAGGLAAALILTSFYYQNTDGFAISIAVLLAGLICTARLILKEHSLKEVYTGLGAGLICQLLSYYFVM